MKTRLWLKFPMGTFRWVASCGFSKSVLSLAFACWASSLYGSVRPAASVNSPLSRPVPHGCSNVIPWALFLSSCICSPPLLIHPLPQLRGGTRRWFQQLNSFYAERIFKYSPSLRDSPHLMLWSEVNGDTLGLLTVGRDRKTFRNEGQALLTSLPPKNMNFHTGRQTFDTTDSSLKMLP